MPISYWPPEKRLSRENDHRKPGFFAPPGATGQQEPDFKADNKPAPRYQYYFISKYVGTYFYQYYMRQTKERTVKNIQTLTFLFTSGKLTAEMVKYKRRSIQSI